MSAEQKRPGNAQIEQLLGREYARYLKENQGKPGVCKNASEDIMWSLRQMESINKINLLLRQGLKGPAQLVPASQAVHAQPRQNA